MASLRHRPDRVSSHRHPLSLIFPRFFHDESRPGGRGAPINSAVAQVINVITGEKLKGWPARALPLSHPPVHGNRSNVPWTAGNKGYKSVLRRGSGACFDVLKLNCSADDRGTVIATLLPHVIPDNPLIFVDSISQVGCVAAHTSRHELARARACVDCYLYLPAHILIKHGARSRASDRARV